MEFKVIEYRQLIQIVIMFLIVQFFGMFLAAIMFSGATYSQIQSAVVLSSVYDIIYYIGIIVIMSIILLLLFKFFNLSLLFRVYEGVLIFITSLIVFSIIFTLIIPNSSLYIYGNSIGISVIAAIGVALVFVFAKNKWAFMRNTAAIVASVGAGVLLGVSFSFIIAYIFMAVLAVYDFIAVFITKHMLSLARIAEDNNLAFMVTVNEIEGVHENNFSKQTLKKIKSSYKKIKNRTIKNLFKKKFVPVAARVGLGTGDLAVPLMVAIAAYGTYMNFIMSFFVIFGAIAGLLATMLILRKYKRALPAIPPLFAGITIFIGLYMLIGKFL